MSKLGAIYARLSREDEDKIYGFKDSRSIENQINALMDYACENEIEIVKVYYDDGYSGENLHRPSFQQMLKDIYAHKFNILLIKDISRLGRIMHQVGSLIEQVFPLNNIRVISLVDGYDSDTYEGESITLRNFLNAYYLKEFKIKCKKSLEQRAKTKHLNYYPKYGYKFDEMRIEQVDLYSSNIVKQIFTYASIGKTTQEIAKILNEEKILTRSEYAVNVLGLKPLNRNLATKWSGEKVWQIIKDYEYCGHSLNLLRKKEPPILVRNTHYAIISEELFEKANEQISKRSKKKANINNLCAVLKDVTSGKNMTYYKAKDDFYYNRLGGFSIKAKTIHTLLYEEVITLIESFVKDKNILKDIYNKRFFNCRLSKKNLKDNLISLNDEYSRLIQDYFECKVTQIKFDNRKQELVTKIKRIEKKLNEYDDYNIQLAIYENKFMKYLNSIKHSSKDEISLIKMIVSKVLVSKVKDQKEFDITIVYKCEEI